LGIAKQGGQGHDKEQRVVHRNENVGYVASMSPKWR
jgi:hypothetical protein